MECSLLDDLFTFPEFIIDFVLGLFYCVWGAIVLMIIILAVNGNQWEHIALGVAGLVIITVILVVYYVCLKIQKKGSIFSVV